MDLLNDAAHQRTLLAAHLRRLMVIDEQLAQRLADVTLRMERDRTADSIDQVAAHLGLGTLQGALAMIVDAAGLRATYVVSLQRQRQSLLAYRRAVELQRISADSLAQVNLDLALQNVDDRLDQVVQQLAELGAAALPEGQETKGASEPVSSPAVSRSEATGSPGRAGRTIEEARGIAPERSAQLRKTLIACDNYFDSNKALRTLFSDARLAPWRNDLPEADSLNRRVDLLIDYLHDKRNTAGDAALALLLEVLLERYDSSDERHSSLLALLGRSTAPSTRSAAQPESATPESSRRAPMLSIGETQIMLARAAAVAQVSIGKVIDGRRCGVPTGTAWLIAPDLAITCWHVVHARVADDGEADPEDLDEQVRDCLLTFDYTTAGQGVDYGIVRLEYAHRDDTRLDYALLRLRDRGDAPLARHAPLPLDLDAPLTALTDLFIIQHPSGQQQQESNGTFVRRHPNKPERVFYTNRTEGGTSGAPVFNRTGWRAVVLHHGANRDEGLGEGILLRAIRDDLRLRCPDLFEEIMRAQTR